jgi:glycosyltransferase involved in cell wall biosynthesis
MLATTSRGGIVSVLEGWRSLGLFDRWPVDWVETHCEGSMPRKALVALKALYQVLSCIVRGHRVVLHLHSASDSSFWRKAVFMAVGRLTGCPVLFHLHGGRFVRFYEEECGPLGKRAIRWFLRRADRIVVLSEWWAEWVRGVSGNPRVVCVPNPVLGRAVRAAPAEAGTILFLGLIGRPKGVFELVEALAGLRKRFPNARLVCAGMGDTAELTEHARRLGVADALVLPGWVEGKAKEEWMRRATVFALPSYAEGMPMSLLEAMAAGIPSVASTVGSIPEVVTDGVNGLLVPPRDAAALERALARLLEDASFAARLAESARETVRARFAGGAVLAQLESAYTEVGVVPRSRIRLGARAPRAA